MRSTISALFEKEKNIRPTISALVMDVFWQCDTEKRFVDPTPAYVHHGPNCYAQMGRTILYQQFGGGFIGFVDDPFQSSQLDSPLLEVFHGEPADVAARLGQYFQGYLAAVNAGMDDEEFSFGPARVTILHHIFGPIGGQPLETKVMIEWINPKIGS